MKKINLKSILKKTFKKKQAKKIKKSFKKVKIKKNLIKKVGRPKAIKKDLLNKTSKNKKLKKDPKKNENLKLTKTLDQKPEIIKIKKQGTEKREYKVKDMLFTQNMVWGKYYLSAQKKLEASTFNVMI